MYISIKIGDSLTVYDEAGDVSSHLAAMGFCESAGISRNVYEVGEGLVKELMYNPINPHMENLSKYMLEITSDKTYDVKKGDTLMVVEIEGFISLGQEGEPRIGVEIWELV